MGGYGIGAGYERAFNKYVGMRVYGNYVSASVSTPYTTINMSMFYPGLDFRVYPMGKALQGFILSAGYQPYIVSVSSSAGGLSALLHGIPIRVAWKFLLSDNKSNGFVIEPYAGYTVAVGSIAGYNFSAGGLNYGASVGWAF